MAALDDTSSVSALPPALEPGSASPGGSRRSFASSRVILALILREMSTRYAKSPGGYIWAILEPLGFIALMAVGFSLMARVPPLGTSFVLFYASGFLPFNLYKAVENDVSSAIVFSRPLLLYPAVTWLDAILARFLLATITNLLVLILIVAGAVVFSAHGARLDFVPMLHAVVAAAVLGLGVGTLNAFLHGRFPLIQTTWKIINRPLFLLSAVIYTLESLPTRLQNILWWNPLVHLTGMMRDGVYPSYQPQYISQTYVYGIAFVSFAMGLLFLRAYSRDLVNKQ